MQKRILCKNLEVSAVGLGCMGFTHAYGTAMDETEAAKAIAEAVDMGYTLLDAIPTSSVFGGSSVKK